MNRKEIVVVSMTIVDKTPLTVQNLIVGAWESMSECESDLREYLSEDDLNLADKEQEEIYNTLMSGVEYVSDTDNMYISAKIAVGNGIIHTEHY